MNKMVKKLLSVVLAVLVLAAGFATTFAAFKPVSAENEWTYDYTTLVPEFDSAKEQFLITYGVSMSNGGFVEAPTSFGFLDYKGIATNLDDDTATGIRISENFYTKLQGESYLVGTDDITEIHPYIIYEVAQNSEFRVQYQTYTSQNWTNQGLSDDLGLIDLFVSSDGVNYVPANVENNIEYKALRNDYDRVTATITNVGANTKYVKIQFRLNPTHKTAYVPQDGIFIQRVKAIAPTAFTENKVTFTKKAVTVNGSASSLAGVFANYPSTASVNENIGITNFSYTKLNNEKAAWGTYTENERDYYLRVQPGTRFFLGFNNQPIHDDFAKALVEQGYIDSHEDFAVKVYTSANRYSGWVEQKQVPTNNYTGESMRFAYNFIVPENHTFVKIVNPIAGTVSTVLNSEGSPVVNQVGNTIIAIDRIFYTPYNEATHSFEKVYDYDTTKIYDVQSSGAITNHNFAFQKGYAFHAKNGETTYVLGSTDTERKDEDLAYAIFQAAGGTMFRAKLQIGYTGNWRKEGHDKAKSADAEEMHFAILTSSDMTNWTLQNTLGTDDDFYVCDSTSNGKNYNVDVFVPEDHQYVKIVSYCRGYYVESGGNKVYFDDQFGIHGASFSTKKNETVVNYDYTNRNAGIDIGATVNGNATLQSQLGIYSTSDRDIIYCEGTVIDGLVLPYANPYGVIYPDLPEQYIIYNVKPGTTFVADFYLASDTATNNAYVKQRLSEAMVNAKNEAIAAGEEWTASTDYEFIISASESATGGWSNAVTTKGSNSNTLTYTYQVPENCNFVKITYPDKGRVLNVPNAAGSSSTTSYVACNGLARIKGVSYVPAGYVEGATEYDYRDTTLATVGNQVKDHKEVLGVYSATEGILFNEAAARKAINVSYNAINKEWGTVGPFEVVYEVQPGSKFSTDLYLASGSIPGWNKQTLSHLLGGTPWEFTVEASNAVDGEWKNKVDTSSYTSAEITLDYDVPWDCKFVKITFPQKGQVETLCTDTTCSGYNTNHLRTDPIQGNDLALVRSVSYIPYSEIYTNDYAKGEASFTDANKVAYNLYKLNGVEATANGVVAKADATEAFVEYKVSDAAALVINTANDLKFAVSYDGVSFVEAELSSCDGAYTVDLVEDKQYVRVYLGEGDVITAVTAKHLNPTATFINAAGKTESVDVAYGAIPTAPALNTNRTGYTFDKWGKGLIEGIFVDTVYEAVYNKDETNLFTVGLKTGSEGKITVNNDRTLDTVRFDDRVTVEAPASYSDGVNTVVFDKWFAYDSNGNELGTISNSHKFSFLVSDSITLEARYVNQGESKTEGKPFIFNGGAIVEDNADGTWNMSVIWRVNAPADAVVIETGILFAATDLGAEGNTKEECDAAWKAGIEADTAKVIAHKTTAANKTLMYTVNNIAAEKTARFAVPYAIVDGEYVFGNVVSAQ